jgi:hypothetical protein
MQAPEPCVVGQRLLTPEIRHYRKSGSAGPGCAVENPKPRMANCPDVHSEAKLSIAELEEYRQVVQMTRTEAEREYVATHNACRLNAGRLPSPKLVQELVQAWKRVRGDENIVNGGALRMAPTEYHGDHPFSNDPPPSRHASKLDVTCRPLS